MADATIKDKSLLERAAIVLQAIQQVPASEWNNRILREFDLSPYISDSGEGEMLCHIMTMALGETPSAGALSSVAQNEFPPTSCTITLYCLGERSSDLEVREPQASELEREANFQAFLADDSLAKPTQARMMSTHFKSDTLRQSLDFIGWRENMRWAAGKRDDGYHMGFSHSQSTSSQTMFYVPAWIEQVNRHFKYLADQAGPPPEPPLGSIYADKQEKWRTDLRSFPRMWGDCMLNIFVPMKDAQAILVDFIGLDPVVLGLDKGLGVSGSRR